MKKLFISLTIFLILIIALATLPFTKVGNSYLANYIENMINQKQTNLHIKVSDFSLSFNKISLKLIVDESSNLDIFGDINLLKQTSNLDYKLYIDNLSILNSFFDGLTLNGTLNTSGKVDISLKDMLIVGDSSNILNGKLDFSFKDNILSANLKNANSKMLLKTLNYKEFFNSSLDIDLTFNNLTKISDIELQLNNGHFLKSNFSEILKNLAKVDITKEIFSNSKIVSKIENKTLNSTIFMQSKNVQISSNSSFIDLNKEYIDTKLQFKLKDKSFNIDLKNSLKNPDIKLDINNILQNEINRFLNKFLK